MLRKLLNERQQAQRLRDVRRDRGFQIVLWSIWTFVVVAVGYFNWHADMVAHHPIDTLGLVIHCLVAGVIGLVVLTKIEMHMEPWRFIDRR